MEDLGNGSEAVGGAAGVRDDVHGGVILFVVDTHDEDGRVVLRGSRDDGLLGTTLEVSASGVSAAEDTGALSDVVGADTAPRDLARVGLLEDIDLLAVDFDTTICLFDSALEAT